MLLRTPDRAELEAIFLQQCEKYGFAPSDALIDRFILKNYTRTGRKFRRCHPRDVISQAADYIAFSRLKSELTDDLLDHAFECCFSSNEDLSES